MKKIIVLITLSLILFSCESDNGIREVYVEIEVKDQASHPDNGIVALVTAMDANGNQIVASAGVNGSDDPMKHTSELFTYEVGQNVTYNMLSYDWSGSSGLERIWGESRVRVYSGRKKILDITYMPGDAGSDSKNLIIE